MIKKPPLIIYIVLALILIYFIAVKDRIQNSQEIKILRNQINEDGGVSVGVTPLNFETGKNVSFQVTLDTHRGDLGFDMAEISLLNDDKGNEYDALEWQGGKGGHHLIGTLIFPAISSKSKTMKLTINDGYQRIFEWDLR